MQTTRFGESRRFYLQETMRRVGSKPSAATARRRRVSHLGEHGAHEKLSVRSSQETFYALRQNFLLIWKTNYFSLSYAPPDPPVPAACDYTGYGETGALSEAS